MPRAGFGGEELHPLLHEKAEAYLFHLVKDHPFVDDNKRVGLAVCLVVQGAAPGRRASQRRYPANRSVPRRTGVRPAASR